MGIEITCKLKETLANIFKREIEELGFDTSSLTTNDDVLQSYCSYTYRLIDKRPRTIYKATSFTCPVEVEIGLKWLEEKIRHSCISPWQYNHVIQRLWTL